MSVVIEVNDLQREYVIHNGLFSHKKKIVQALQGISFEVYKGEVFSLLGPNGAGKTTTIKILATLLAPTAGSARVLGYDVFTDPRPIRRRINLITGGERNVYWRLTGRQNLHYFADLYQVPRSVQATRIPQLLELVGLQKWADNRVETYSKGMKQKLQIARGLVNDPDILFMDEPSLGLDPVAAQELRELIARLRDHGKTIILTTHYMFEADLLSDRIAIINQGQIVALDTPDNLKRHTVGLSVVEVHTSGVSPALISELHSVPSVLSINIRTFDQRQVIEIQTEHPQGVLTAVQQRIPATQLLRSHVREATLEDAYIKLVGGQHD